MIETQWLALLERFPDIELVVYQIMPNHAHGISVIVEPEIGVNTGPGTGIKPAPTHKPTLGDIVGAFKSITTHEYIQGVGNKNWRQLYKIMAKKLL